jgi:hypothetical protein
VFPIACCAVGHTRPMRAISAAGFVTIVHSTFADSVPEQPAEELHHGFKISNFKFEIQNLFLLHGP